jgi:hypothetical protein
VTWSSRVIAIPVNRALGSSGYFDIDPTTYTLGAWTALYYVPTRGANNAFSAGNFQTKVYTDTVVVSDRWIFICSRNGDDNSLKWNPAFISIPSGGTYYSSTSICSWGPGPTGPTGSAGSGGGGGSVSITGSTGVWSVLTVATGGTGLYGNSNLTFNSSNMLTVTGALTVANGYRPSYVKISSGTSITPAASSYGTHYDIYTSAITGITISYPASGQWSNDSNGYWVFRNNTGTYLSITMTYSNAAANIYPSNMIIPPANSVTLMASYPGGGSNSNYVLF